LKDCIFFDRFQKGRCFSLYEVLPSVAEREGDLGEMNLKQDRDADEAIEN